MNDSATQEAAKAQNRLIWATILTVLVIINSLIFGLLSAYRFTTNQLSMEGRMLISQYSMFTDWDLHDECSFCNNDTMKCPFIFPRGILVCSEYHHPQDSSSNYSTSTLPGKEEKDDFDPKKYFTNITRTTTPYTTPSDDDLHITDIVDIVTDIPEDTKITSIEQETTSNRESTTIDVYQILFPQFPKQGISKKIG